MDDFSKKDNDHDFNAECENICGDDSLMELVKIADFKILTTNVQTPNPLAILSKPLLCSTVYLKL